MSFWFIITLILLVPGLLILAASRVAKGDSKTTFTLRGGGITALAIVCLIISSFSIVSTRQVGIVLSFGKPVGERGAGLAWHLPWQKVVEMDAAVQLQSFDGDDFDNPGNAIKVRLGNNSAAFVEANLNWRIKQQAAGHLFQDYRTFDNIRANLVDRQLQVALSKHFAEFNPQTAAGPVAPAPDPNGGVPKVAPVVAQGTKLPDIAAQVKNDLQHAVGQDIEILDVRIPGIFYDGKTQELINAYNQKVQETVNALQDVATADAERQAAEKRFAQAKPDLTVAIANCIVERSTHGHDPAGCWGQIGGQPLISIPAPGQ